VHSAHPQPLTVKSVDREFLLEVARKILGSGSVAATTEAGLLKQGIDANRVYDLIPTTSVAVELAGYVFKKVEADHETPQDFGLFVRRRRDIAAPPNSTPTTSAPQR
jgi:hypothetical protein